MPRIRHLRRPGQHTHARSAVTLHVQTPFRSCPFVHSNLPGPVGLQGAMAPAPAPVAGPPPLPKASDALALTNSSLNQLQARSLASSRGCSL